MPHSSPVNARAQHNWNDKLSEGTIISFTHIAHPPKGFAPGPRYVALIDLDRGGKAIGHLIVPEGTTPEIGKRVHPRLRLTSINEQKLRRYDVCYELVVRSDVANQEFPGYILALSGPSGVGKTTVSVLLKSKLAILVEKPVIVTTKHVADNDDEYEQISKEEFLSLKEHDELAAFTKIPSATDDRWYGYRKSDIEAIWADAKIPVVITEMGLLESLADCYGRRPILSFGLLPPGKSKRTMLSALLHRLRSRGRDSEESIRDRMENAERDLDFFAQKRELFDHLIVNDDLDHVVHCVSEHVNAVSHQ